jgi:hypothetical protein
VKSEHVLNQRNKQEVHIEIASAMPLSQVIKIYHTEYKNMVFIYVFVYTEKKTKRKECKK